jgi:hypothetical protein
MAVRIRHTTWHPQSANLALTSPTCGGRSVGIVRSRIQTMEFSFFLWIMLWRRVGEWRYSSIILSLGTKWWQVVIFTFRPLYLPPPGEKSPGTYRTGGWEGPIVAPDVVFQTVQFQLRKYVKTAFPWKLHEKQVMTKSHTKSIISQIYTPWSESASELYRPSHRRLSAELLRAFVDRGCRVVSMTDP